MAAVRYFRLMIILSDGEVDAEEEAWEATSCRAEFDAFGLCMSCIWCQLVRLAITTQMPLANGTERPDATGAQRGWLQVGIILGVAIGCRIPAYFLNKLGDTPPQHISDPAHWLTWLEWASLRLVYHILSKLTGWLVLYANMWALQLMLETAGDQSVRFRSFVALFATLEGFLVIFLLNLLPGEDSDYQSGSFRFEIMQSMAVAVGFGWRRLYGLTFNMVCSTYGPKLINDCDVAGGACRGELLLQIICAVVLAGVYAPMHYMYIIPKCLPKSIGQAHTPEKGSIDDPLIQ
jgi:hypothetical protein